MNYQYLRYLARTGITYLHPHRREATELLIAQLDLRPGEQVLEIGCGSGATLVEIALRYPVQLRGIDLLEEMLAVARRRVRLCGLTGRIQLQQGRENIPLPFADASFDKVYCESVLGIQDAASAQLMLGEIYRVLKPGGRFVTNEAIWKTGIPEDRIATINRAGLSNFGLRQASEEPWTLPNWLALFRTHGFTAIACPLLADLPRASGTLPVRPQPGKRWRSEALTRMLQLKSLLHPGLLRERRRYRQLLHQHRGDGQFVEARLFTLLKTRKVFDEAALP